MAGRANRRTGKLAMRDDDTELCAHLLAGLRVSTGWPTAVFSYATAQERARCGRRPGGQSCALYLLFLAAFLSFFSFGVSLGLFVLSVRFLS
jgi:hypothetical protein